MMKLAVIVALIGVVVSSGIPAVPLVSQVVSPVISPVVSSQRAVIPQISSYGYGNGVSSRYFDKVDYGYGSGVYGAGLGLGGIRAVAPGYLGAAGNLITPISNLGLAYNNYGLNDGRVLGLGYGLGRVGYGLGGVGYGLGGVGYGLGRVGYGLGGVKYV